MTLYTVVIALEAPDLDTAHKLVSGWGVGDAEPPEHMAGLQHITGPPETWAPELPDVPVEVPKLGPPPDFSGEPKPKPPPDDPGSTAAPSTTEPELPVEIRSEMLDETQTESDDLATP